MMSKFLHSLCTCLLLMLCFTARGQFYNGLQNDFGKNRIQYKQRDWQFYRFDKYDVYFYQNGAELAAFAAESINSNILEFENKIDFTLEDRVEFILYNRQTDFKQSNIGLVTTDPNNIGGTTRVVGNKVFLFFESDRQQLEKQIRAGVADVIISQWLYGGSWKDRVKSSTLLHLPEWYTRGLINFLAGNWSIHDEEKLRDGILTRKFRKFNHLEGENANIAGYSIWKYISDNYGFEVIPNLIYLSQVSRNIESGFNFVLGAGIGTIIDEWFRYYTNMYEKRGKDKSMPVFSKEQFPFKVRKNRVYSQWKTSPDKKYAVYASNEMGQVKIFLVDLNKKSRKRIFKQDVKLERITDYSYPLLCWHPSSSRFAFVTENKGDLYLQYFDMETMKTESKPPLTTYDKILDMNYAPDGKRLLLSAMKKGQTDIYVYNLASNTSEQITNDVYDDRYPAFIKSGKEIIFSSNRNADSLDSKLFFPEYCKSKYDLFVYEYSKKNRVLRRLTQTPEISEIQNQQVDENHFIFLADESRQITRMYGGQDSVLAFVDTTEHYRYYLSKRPISAYAAGILEQQVSKDGKEINQIFYHKGRYRPSTTMLMQNPGLNNPGMEEQSKGLVGAQENARRNEYQRARQIFTEPDSGWIKKRIRFQSYNFELENQQVKQTAKAVDEKNKNQSSRGEKSTVGKTGIEFELPKQLNYFRFFTLDQITTQFNNNFVNPTYQKFTGGEVFFNPGINGMIQIGLSDVFEDYRLFGGFKLSADLRSNEFLAGIEDRAHRWDRTYTFYRQSFPASRSQSAAKILSHTLTYALRYPFSEVSSIRFSLSARNDRSVYQSSDLVSLARKNTYDYWAMGKAEYIYDNSRQKAINIFNGMRFKVFGEYFNSINLANQNLTVLGADFRYYQKIYKNFIFACRAASSTSFGPQKLVYYLGATDNWINLSTSNPTFNRNIPVANQEQYAFQALATNMRGFSQNIRNGNSFCVFNNELRLPVFTVLYNRPLRSDFLSNLQVIGFYDVGTAWTGISPFGKGNIYNSEIISAYPVSVTIKKDRQPFVTGYGWGLRSRLFGYFVRLDWAWGQDDGEQKPRIFYLSLATDF